MQQHVGVAHLAQEFVLVGFVDNDGGQVHCANSLLQPGTGAILQYRFHPVPHPPKVAAGPRAASMRSPSFHFAILSERAKEPTLSWPAFQPTARWTIVTSSVSPERAETTSRQLADPAASKAALVSVTVPAWFGFNRTALQAPREAAAATRAAEVTR